MIVQALLSVVFLPVLAYGYGTIDNQLPYITLGDPRYPPAFSGQMFGDNLYVEDLVQPRITLGLLFSYSSFTISKNGYVYFNVVGPAQRYDEFSSFSTPDFVIAPFWDDMSVGLGGHVKYEIHDETTGGGPRGDVGNYIDSVLGESISVNSLLIVEWKNMQSNSFSSSLSNTFQVVIASNNYERSFAIFTYKCGELQWSTSSSTIGFKSTGDVYRNHPFSRVEVSPNPIACVNSPNSQWSNVVYDIGVPLSCEVYLGFFGCNSGVCTPLVKQCNGQWNCIDGSDEVGCNTPTSAGCTAGQFTCSNGGCVISTDRCNGQQDCSDGSDEAGCPCSSGQFACNSGGCISSLYRCDGYNDCPDGSDEFNCSPGVSTIASCTVGEFTCSSGECISASRHCNGHFDCQDGSDENGCSCLLGEFTCSSGECISGSKHCNGQFDCQDGSDENGCGTATDASCAVGQLSCSSGGCISATSYCNGYRDCNDGSDETRCGLSTSVIAGIASGVLVGVGLLGALCVATIVGLTVLYLRKSRSVAFQRFDTGPPAQVQYSNSQQQVGFTPPPQYTPAGSPPPTETGVHPQLQNVDLNTASTASDSGSNFSSDVEDSRLLKV